VPQFSFQRYQSSLPNPLARLEPRLIRWDCLYKKKFLFTVNGNSKRKIVKIVYNIVVAEMWIEVLSFPSPLLSGTSHRSWHASSLGSTGVHGSLRAGLEEVRWSSLPAGLALQQSFTERKRVYPKCVRQKWTRRGGGALYKTKQKPLESFKKLTYLLKVVQVLTKWCIQHDTSRQEVQDKLE